MYFFIALVMVTFLTLYAYFVIVQKSEQQARERLARKKRGLMDDETSSANVQSTNFVDFLSGSFDAGEIVHSRPTPRVINPAMKTALTTGAQAVAIGLGMGAGVFQAAQ